MRTKLVYVLTSTENDIYWEETLLSMYSARYRMPNVEIVLIVDNETDKGLKGKRARILDYTNEKVVINLSDKYTMKQKSRILKTSSRDYVSGDMLYIDVDTIVCADLSSLDELKIDIGAVRDGAVPIQEHINYQSFKRQCKQYGFELEHDSDYFNGGVIYAKDNEKSRAFFAKWKENYLNGLNNHVDFDMPSLAKTNCQFNQLLCELPIMYNSQLPLAFVPNMKILHYFASILGDRMSVPVSKFMQKELFYKIKHDGCLTEEVKQLAHHPEDSFVAMTVFPVNMCLVDRAVQILDDWYHSNNIITNYEYHTVKLLLRIINKLEEKMGIIK